MTRTLAARAPVALISLVSLVSLVPLVGGLAACKESRFDRPLVLGGALVQPDVLEKGWQVYRRMCVGCHGEAGDGHGDAAGELRPPPRDLRSGHFKFASVPAGELPTDDDLRRTIRQGLAGTTMAPMTRLPADEVDAVIQYIKTLSPRWRSASPGVPVPAPPDPWSDLTEAVARGRAVYHGEGRCWTCHPAYVPLSEIAGLPPSTPSVETIQSRDIAFRGDISRSRAVETAFGKVLPPDFLGDTVRAGDSVKSIFRIISAGIGGSAMPGMYEALSPVDRWAVAHYVGRLIRAKGTPEAERLRGSRLDEPSPRAPARGPAGEPGHHPDGSGKTN